MARVRIPSWGVSLRWAKAVDDVGAGEMGAEVVIDGTA